MMFMRIVWSWDDFLNKAGKVFPDIGEILKKYLDEFNKAIDGGENYDDALQSLLESIAEFDGEGYYKHAPEYGERAWIIKGKRLSILVWDLGNGSYDPIGVIIDVDGRISLS